MAQRGRPPIKRAPGDMITQKGVTVRQAEFLRKGFKRRGFESAAHYLRYIVDMYIERVEAGDEEDRFTPRGIKQIRRSQ